MRNILMAAAALMAMAGTAQAQDGAKVFQQCADCHSLAAGGPEAPGPNLSGVLGRKAGTKPAASPAMKAAGDKGLVWTEAALDKYLDDPQAMVPDNAMEFYGGLKAEDRKALIDYIKGGGH